MNNFEERMLCDYLLKVKDKISFCSEEFRNFYLDLKKQLNLDGISRVSVCLYHKFACNIRRSFLKTLYIQNKI